MMNPMIPSPQGNATAYPFAAASPTMFEPASMPMMPMMPMMPPMPPMPPMHTYQMPPYPMGPMGQMGQFPTGAPVPGTTAGGPAGPAVFEESYIENILRLNLGKMATVYMTFENNSQWNAKIFKGRVEAAGRDHIIISDPATGIRYLLLMVNLDYVTFDEPLNYEYPGTLPAAAATGR